MNLEKNVERKEGFNQVCIWPSCTLGKSSPEEFQNDMKEMFNANIQFLEEIETTPDIENGKIVPHTGKRHDLFFAVHINDISGFAVPRLQAGIRWIEDVLAECNYKSPIYPKRIFDYCTWNEEHLAKNETF